MKLSILIPTISRRRRLLDYLLEEFSRQIGEPAEMLVSVCMLKKLYTDIEIIISMEENSTIGYKRNLLLNAASGKYVCFFDDDDQPGENYIATLMRGIKEDPDCISLRGIMTTDGQNPELFEHSIKYSSWKTTDNTIKYERNPNHLNCIRASIAKQFAFPEINHGEDHKWSQKLQQSGMLKKEYYTEEILYHYKYVTNK